MTDDLTSSRRRPPAVAWFLLGVTVLAFGACVVMTVVAWQEAAQVQTLQTEVQVMQEERQSTEDRLVALQVSSVALQERIALLEANDPAQQLAALQAELEATTETEDLEELRASFTEIQATVDAFQHSLDAMADRLNALESADGITTPLAEAHLEVARQKQSHSLSCESSASSMAAQYHGVELGESDILATLPFNDNPYLGFRGNVDGPTGGIQDYGVYAGPIMTILNDHGLMATLVEGGLEGIKAAISRGNPVIAWVTYNCLPSTPVDTLIDGQTIALVPNQHVVVVTGYDANGVWANDPWDGLQDFYPTADFERAMRYFGNMAIEVASR